MSLGRPQSVPRSEEELQARVRALAGHTLGALAGRLGLEAPPNLRRHKGWVGQLLEDLLGATAASRSEPDFQAISVELKSLPVDARGMPRESTYVCHVPLSALHGLTWETSPTRRKLARVLWVPVEAMPEVPLAERRVGAALLWSPEPDQEHMLREDWEDLVERIRLGYVDTITGHDGQVLQIRPKGADSKATMWGVGESGEPVEIMPRGWYLRASFTREILRRHYALPA